MDWIELAQWAVIVGVLVRIEGFTAKRLKKDAKAVHQETSEMVTADSQEQLERVLALIKNHISGPTHRR